MTVELGPPIANLGSGEVIETTSSPVVLSTLAASAGISLGPIVGKMGGGSGFAYSFTPVSGRTYRVSVDRPPKYAVCMMMRWSGSGTSAMYANGEQMGTSPTHYISAFGPDSDKLSGAIPSTVRFDFSGSYRILIAGSDEPFYNMEPPTA